MVLVKRSRAARILFALAGSLLLAGCITVPNGKAPEPSQGPTAPLTYLDRLKDVPVAGPTEDVDRDDLAQFVTDTRNIACVFTQSRAGHLNQPWEPNNFTDSANAAAPLVPVVNCQMTRYPEVQEQDKLSDCSGTLVGYLGGTALLEPERASYGGCRAGVTAVEAAFGPDGVVNQTMAEIPVLSPGQGMESNGYRCAAMDDGVACANLAAGVGFFLSAEKYELFGNKPA